MFNTYNYLAVVDRIIDGDTIVITVDAGFYLKYKTQVRLLRVNAPETRGATREKGLETKNFYQKLFQLAPQSIFILKKMMLLEDG